MSPLLTSPLVSYYQETIVVTIFFYSIVYLIAISNFKRIQNWTFVVLFFFSKPSLTFWVNDPTVYQVALGKKLAETFSLTSHIKHMNQFRVFFL